jgi:hypothetical protein
VVIVGHGQPFRPSLWHGRQADAGPHLPTGHDWSAHANFDTNFLSREIGQPH